MALNTIKIRDELIGRLRSAYDAAIFSGITHAALLDSVASCYAALPRRTPEWIRQYGKGYEKARTDDMYARHLMFGGFYRGTFYSTHSKRADYYERNGIEPSAFADDGAVTARGHYWIDRPSNPFFLSKP